MFSLPGGGFFGGPPSIPAPPPIPAPLPPPVAPRRDEEAALKAKKRTARAAQASSGRASTLLSEIGTGEKLGA